MKTPPQPKAPATPSPEQKDWQPPDEIIKAAHDIDAWMQTMGCPEWQLGPCASRKTVDRLMAELQPAPISSAPDWQQYQRKGLSEMRPYVPGENMNNVSISEPDKLAGSPKPGDMIARNPENHADQWLVAKKYFEDNLELVSAPDGAGTPTPETDAACKDAANFGHHEVVRSDFARKLEQQRDALKAERVKLQAEVTRWTKLAEGAWNQADKAGTDAMFTTLDFLELKRKFESASQEVEGLKRAKERYEFCKRHMLVCTHGIAPGITELTMYGIRVDTCLLGADEIIDHAMKPGTAANVQALIDKHTARSATPEERK